LLRVHLWAGLRRFTGGEEVVEVEAATIGQMLTALGQAHPGLAPILATGVSVVVDGEMMSSRHGPLTAANEIYLIQRVKGG
jgi:molybdopterin converting factor small subunit